MVQEYIKKYRLAAGTVISLFIAFLAFLPQITQGKDDNSVILANVLVIFIYALSCWVFNSYMITAVTLPLGGNRRGLRPVLSFLFSVMLSYILLYLIRRCFSDSSILAFRHGCGHRRILGAIIFRGFFMNAFLYFIAYILQLNTRTQQAMLENERLKHENLEARLHVLRQQLSPHFLFNSLGILNTLTEDPAVRKYIIQLSHIYRYLLAAHEGHLALLSKEIEFINAYLYIIKERFEDALEVTMDIDEDCLDKRLPPAALQLLIENAIKHNVVSVETPLFISVAASGGYVVVSNNVNLKLNDIAEANGIGLHNIAERYSLLSGKEMIIEHTTASFTVKLPLIA